MSNLIDIPKESLPKCAVCGDREVVRGHMEKKDNKSILTFYCHGEEDVFEGVVGDKMPEVAFAPITPAVKSKAGPDKKQGKSKK